MTNEQFAMFIDNADARRILEGNGMYDASICMESDVYIGQYLDGLNSDLSNTELHKLEHIANGIIGGEAQESVPVPDPDPVPIPKSDFKPDTTLIHGDLCYYSDNTEDLYSYYGDKTIRWQRTMKKHPDGKRWMNINGSVGWNCIKQVPLDHIKDDALRKEVAQLRLKHLKKEKPLIWICHK